MKGLVEQYKKLGVRWAALLLVLFVCLSGRSVFARQDTRIFMVKSRNISSYNLAIEGFRQRASAKWVIVEYDLGGTFQNTDKMIKRLEKEKPDLVVAVGAKAMAALSQSRVLHPVIFCMVMDLCMVMNPAAHDLQGFNTTGISLAISPGKQMEILTSLNPKIKRIGVLLRKQSSADLLKNVTELAAKYKVKIIPVELESEKEIPRKLRPILDKVDALWMLDDSFIHSRETLNFVIVNCLENNLAFMAISKVFVKEGALVSLSPSYFRNGEQTAQLAKRILTEGINPKNIPISFHKNPDLVINLKIAHKIKLTIPPAILDKAKVYE